MWRILARASNRGAKSALWVRRGLDPKAAWVELTADWTAPLEYEAPVREYLEKLKALGYTQPGRIALERTDHVPPTVCCRGLDPNARGGVLSCPIALRRRSG